MIDLDAVSTDRLRAMQEAGADAALCQRMAAKSGVTMIDEVMRGCDEASPWTHFPPGDVYDPEHHSQYYYHVHPPEEQGEEHGHFHTFLRPSGMPEGTTPAPVVDFVSPADPNDALSHLVAISMDPGGEARSLFVTNRWVTAETWYAADHVIAMLDCFAIELARPSWPLNRWITALFKLFRPDIEHLLVRRDAVIAEHGRCRPDVNVLEDRSLEVPATLRISVPERIEAVAGVLRQRRRAARRTI
ncbi:MAG: DUF6969 family protein [Inquilinaceae bacterium]